MQQIIKLVLGLSLQALASLSYAQLSQAEASHAKGSQTEHGEKLFQSVAGVGCVACHGQYAHGGGMVGGNIRGASLAQLEQALSEEPTMRLLADALQTEQREALVAHLAKLGALQLVEWSLSDEYTEPSAQKVDRDQAVQVVIFNGRFETAEVDLSSIDQPTMRIEPYATAQFIWQPQQDLQLNYLQQQLRIEVAAAAENSK